jgi:hypothetical protein
MHIIKAWSDSIAKTRQLNQLNTLTAINQAHKYQFAISLLDAIETMSNYPYFFQERFLEQTLQQLKSWCKGQQTQAEFFLVNVLQVIMMGQIQKDSAINNQRVVVSHWLK